MENTTSSPGPSLEANPEKQNKKIWVIILGALAIFLLAIVAVGFLSRWECKDGAWKKKGLPLSGRPQGQCETPMAIERKKAKEPLSKEKTSLPPAVMPFQAEGLEVLIPVSGSEVTSPLVVKGRAKGTWFFEGSFPLKLADEKGNIFAESYASAEGEWMTTDWVNFSGTIEFSPGNNTDGFLVLEKDNPSGQPELDYAVSIPLKFNANSSGSSAAPSSNISSECGHDPKDDPILGDCGEDCNLENWKIFKSQKYGYSFRYPADYALTSNCKHENCISEENGGDTVTLSGDLSDQGWPMIEIRHLSNIHYNPPAQTDLPAWIQEKFPWTKKCFPNAKNIFLKGKNGQVIGGFNLFSPQTSQSYSIREIYFMLDGKLFQIVMLDAVSPQARQFYDIWLSAFRAAE